ncbi:CBO0543 family protein [Fredinandcohnia quinoae]|uniref:Uncharacterized protein n=1 Tax=Fredinandcohnia quinoae TaxID=2918902 RepID=A0AAW5E328_9BACI|nr:CBO0543 family protein [Fredinandcohnia sp. SECRCQ15]MCH1624396.1 hypothetical protein [Fredinandcohnia sp. SECRCQ15]
MLIEHLILIGMWVIGFASFLLFVPRKKWRRGLMAILVFQAWIWLFDMPAFQLDWLTAPVRELPKATDLPLTIDYFFYPVLFSIYYVNKKVMSSQWYEILYFFAWVSVITLFDVCIERYTDLLEYGYLTWYWMWLYLGFLFYISRVCCSLFYNEKASFLIDWRLGK